MCKYSRLCLEAPVFSHVVRRNVALQLLAGAVGPFLQVPGQPPALVGLVQDLELVPRVETQVLSRPSLVIKESHKELALASLGLWSRRPGRIRRVVSPWVLNHPGLVRLLRPPAEGTAIQVGPEPQAEVTHGGPGKSGGEGLLPLPSLPADPLSLPPPGNFAISTNPAGSGREYKAPFTALGPTCLQRLTGSLSVPPGQNPVESGQLIGGKVSQDSHHKKKFENALFRQMPEKRKEASWFLAQEKVTKRNR